METDFSRSNSLWNQVPASELDASTTSADGCKKLPAWCTDPILLHATPALPGTVNRTSLPPP